MQIALGVKADPIQYRYSYEWLFTLLEEEGVEHVQLGTFFELYQLPDDWFLALRDSAAAHGVKLSSLFTAHRELGGFFEGGSDWEQVARLNYERLIEVGRLLGCRCVGSNPGAVFRDRMESKATGIACYMRHMKELMGYAREQGLEALTIEPMSCLAEPPTLPTEYRAMTEELLAHHRAHPDTTVPVGLCADVAHGYADADSVVIYDNMTLLTLALPYLRELHLKNTDKLFDSTFGFTAKDREKGVVNLKSIRQLLLDHADQIPVDELVGYFEFGGPKLGRDYSDPLLEQQLRESLRYLSKTFTNQTAVCAR